MMHSLSSLELFAPRCSIVPVSRCAPCNSALREPRPASRARGPGGSARVPGPSCFSLARGAFAATGGHASG
eukprot:scaffold320213_cov27-Tisochrysis_lutea.AAC.2